METVLLAGASGTLGKHVARELKAKGYSVRALTRSSSRLESIQGLYDSHAIGDLMTAEISPEAFEGVDVIISCVGASLDLLKFSDRASFYEVDFQANCNFLNAALKSKGFARIKKFVYVSFYFVQGLEKTEYFDAHERFVQTLKESGLPHTIIRPTAFFSLLLLFLQFAEKGLGAVIGSGKPRINPIHEKDVARAIVQGIASQEASLDVGGPEVFSRDQITELALRATGRSSRLLRIPIVLERFFVTLLRPFNKRIYQFMKFATVAHTIDIIAPAYGVNRLEDYFAEYHARVSSSQKAGT
ncbi:MAG: SDR family oxidoreductase [Spirochaetia bacterium]|nr:SDR family oxidoreductase [Spirochaetia bacterium]